MPNKLAHFAIEADNIDRARSFWGGVFGWTFEPWGPPGFYLVNGAGVLAALQQRQRSQLANKSIENFAASRPQHDSEDDQILNTKGFECSIAVDDLVATAALIRRYGGQVTDERVELPTVGALMQFNDTEGNHAIIIQYEEDVAKTMYWNAVSD